jgi:UDP-glucose 4-epimerase
MNESSSIQNILLYVPRIIDAIKNGSIIIIDDIDKKFSKKLVNIIEELLLDKTINKNNTQLIATVSDKEYIGESEKVLWI